MKFKTIDDRRRAIITDILNGMTLEKAGYKYFISSERCRQIVWSQIRRKKVVESLDLPDRYIKTLREHKDQVLPYFKKT